MSAEACPNCGATVPLDRISDHECQTDEGGTMRGEYPSFDEVEDAGLDGTLRTARGSGPEGQFTWADLDKRAAKRNFLMAVKSFAVAGRRLAAAWDEDGFNADVEAPLPEGITPPMSFDEWVEEFSGHYIEAFASDLGYESV